MIIQPRPLKSGESSRLDYQRHNAAARGLGYSANEASQLRYKAEQRSDFDLREPFFPFRLYQIPQVYRDTAPYPPEDWRTWVVRGGRVLELDVVDGTDGITNPDREIYPDSSSDVEIVVPINSGPFWFWLEIGTDDDGNTTAVVRYGPDPTVTTYTDPVFADQDWTTTNPWTSFERPDGDHIPIGTIDTNTEAAISLPLRRQYLRTDLVFLGGTCF
jgi:hypothetical protein